ncbi:MAG TPA: pyridoxal-phosphate dependent enzyme, partial [Candidatus Kryptonia bacterium]|nr:pyridoxal-phosphate dependent enzyme [Candidatus Kryptonia bacterium]
MLIPLDDIRAARDRAAGIVKVTPLDLSATFSGLCRRQIYLKLENLQKTGSFKVRGALNKIQLMDPAARAHGVITASAGNHAQGVALAARKRGIPAVIVMPQTTPAIKVKAVLDLGAEALLRGDIYDAAYDHALTLARERHLVFVHPFDDPDVIAGQGTIGMEVLRQSAGQVDAIFVPIGGGGLISGIGAS